MVWGLDPLTGDFPVEHHTKETHSDSPYTIPQWLNKLMASEHKTVKELLVAELEEVHERLDIENKRFEIEYPTEKDKGQRLMFLFQRDLLPGISGQVLDAKDSRDDQSQLRTVSYMTKVCGWIFIAALNLSLLFYIFLFAVSQDQYRQRAWAKSFATWMVMEVLITSSIVVWFTHVFLPTWTMQDVHKVKSHLIESIAKYHKALSSKKHRDVEKTKQIHANHDDSQEDEEDEENEEDFNVAKYLFVSYRLAQMYPELRVSQIIHQFSTPWPRQSYQHVTDVSQVYDKRFAAIYNSITMVAMFFLTSLLTVPQSIQDMIITMCTTTVTGYTVFVHFQLYQIYPVLIAVPTILVAAIVHFFVQSSKTSSQIELAKMLSNGGNENDRKQGSAHHRRKHHEKKVEKNDAELENEIEVMADAEKFNEIPMSMPTDTVQDDSVANDEQSDEELSYELSLSDEEEDDEREQMSSMIEEVIEYASPTHKTRKQSVQHGFITLARMKKELEMENECASGGLEKITEENNSHAKEVEATTKGIQEIEKIEFRGEERKIDNDSTSLAVVVDREYVIDEEEFILSEEDEDDE